MGGLLELRVGDNLRSYSLRARNKSEKLKQTNKQTNKAKRGKERRGLGRKGKNSSSTIMGCKI